MDRRSFIARLAAVTGAGTLLAVFQKRVPQSLTMWFTPKPKGPEQGAIRVVAEGESPDRRVRMQVYDRDRWQTVVEIQS